jgi:hypothetical protein
LRQYATSYNVAGSRPEETNDFFSVYLILPATVGPGVYSASNNSKCQDQKNYVLGE